MEKWKQSTLNLDKENYNKSSENSTIDFVLVLGHFWDACAPYFNIGPGLLVFGSLVYRFLL